MKNNLLLAIISILTAPAAFCAEEEAGKGVTFWSVIGWIILLLVIAYVGLIIYKRFFAKKYMQTAEYDNSLTTPDNVEDAVSFFIRKNKLR